MKGNFKFSSQEKEQIEQAIQGLEKESSGEIVIYFAKNSDNYLEACWKMATYFALFPAIIISVLAFYWLLPEYFTPYIIGLIIIGSTVVGGLIPFLFPKIRLGFISNNKIKQRVESKASNIFLQEEVFKTEERTGVLIYISKLETRVQILGDSGINSRIDQKEWNYVVGLVLNGIKTDKTAEGLVHAIDACKKLLLSNVFIVRADDTDELSNEIRME